MFGGGGRVNDASSSDVSLTMPLAVAAATVARVRTPNRHHQRSRRTEAG